jgi:hypothetical protein
MKKGRLVVEVDELDLELKMLHLKQRCSISMYDTFDQIVNRTMEDLSCAYFHCDLLDSLITLTIVVLKVKWMRKEHLQKNMFVRVNTSGL